jgi:hypothetical protein
MKRYSGSIQVFSGRPNPVWEIPIETGNELECAWEKLKPFEGKTLFEAVLGYQGCKLCVNTGVEFWTYRGVISKKSKEQVEFRLDEDRKIEKQILNSAPAGLIPDDFVGF